MIGTDDDGVPLVRLFFFSEDDSATKELNELLALDSNMFRKPVLDHLGLQMANFSISNNPTFIGKIYLGCEISYTVVCVSHAVDITHSLHTHISSPEILMFKHDIGSPSEIL